MSIAVLVTAEIIAMVYYAALREATQSKILRRLCDQILRDELMHVRFQCEQLNLLRARRSRLGHFFTMAAQRFLFLGTTLIVDISHRRALSRGGYSFIRWWRESWRAFGKAFQWRGEESTPMTSASDEGAVQSLCAPEPASVAITHP